VEPSGAAVAGFLTIADCEADYFIPQIERQAASDSAGSMALHLIEHHLRSPLIDMRFTFRSHTEHRGQPKPPVILVFEAQS